MLCLVLGAGCRQFRATAPLAQSEQPPVIRAVSGTQKTAEESLTLPALEAVVSGQLSPEGTVLPISLDAVLQLAQEQNLKVHLAREKLAEAFLSKELADKRWIPDIWIGPSYYRHEGGIQDQDGRFIHSSFGAFFGGLELRGRFNFRDATIARIKSEQQIHRRQGELSRMNNEVLLDAAQTYIDLLALREAEQLTYVVETKMSEIYKTAKKLAKNLQQFQTEELAVNTAILSNRQSRAKIQQAAQAVTAKLSYLLGLDSNSTIVPVDRRLIEFEIVDATTPEKLLIERALTNGPGVQEMSQLLAHLEYSFEQAQKWRKWLPTMEVRMGEGVFGAGPGSQSTWDNRLDIGFRMRWNLSELFKSKSKRAIAQSKIQQARLGYQELRAKLTLAIREARSTVLHSSLRINQGAAVLQSAQSTYDKSLYWLNKLPLKGPRPSQTLLVLRSWAEAQQSMLEAISEHDKAQLRLMILIGGASECSVKQITPLK